MKTLLINLILATFLVVGNIYPSIAQTPELLYQKGLMKEEGEGELMDAIQFYNQVADNSNADESLQAKALLRIGMCYEKLGKEEAVKAYQKLVNNFPGQKSEVAIAKERLSRLILATEKKVAELLNPKFTKIKMPGSPGNGMLSPDGKKIAFISEGDVWVVPVSGGVNPYITGEPKRLTKNIGALVMSNSFCWSGNGKWIAFNAELLKMSSTTSIYVIPSEGGDVHKVLVPSHYCGWPAEFRLSLSPDGKMLAYVSGWIDYSAKTSKIYTIPVSGGEAKELTEPGTLEPIWSPDGTKIAYVKSSMDGDRNQYSELLVIPAEGGTPKKMINKLKGQIRGPVWSPDGKKIAYIFRPEGKNPKEIWIVPITNESDPSGTPWKVDLPLESYHTIAGWTPDNKIGIQLTNPQYEVIYTVPSVGGIATQVTPQGWTSYPKWSPDGKRIFFRWDGGQIASVPSGGGAVDSIKIDSEFNIYTAVPGSGNEVSPDGKTIVFSGTKHFQKDGKKQWEVDIFTVPVEGGKPTQLTEIAVELQDRFPCWSPDGNSIAFIRPEIIDTKFFMHIYTISRNGENLKKITVKADDIAWAPIDWTPDGKSITFFTNKNSIRSIPVEGGESTLITKIDSVNSQFELAWSPNGEELAYTDKGKIWIFSKESGTSEEVKTGVKSMATKIGWSPDGEKIAFTAFAGGDAELWLMEDFLPLDKLAQKKEDHKENLMIRKIMDGTGAGYPIGTPSPDGKYFAFVDWSNYPNDIVIKENGTSKEIRLRNQTDLNYKGDEGTPYNPIWSPDSKKIAYVWENDKDNFYKLLVIEVDNPKPQAFIRVSYDKGWIKAEDWSPNGQQILIQLTQNNQDQLGLISTVDGSFQLLKKIVKTAPYSAKFSPDGKYIAFDNPPNEENTEHDIFVIQIDGKQETKLTSHPSHDYFLDWSLSGEKILFASDRTGTTDMWSISFSGRSIWKTPELVSENIGNIKALGITNGGSFYYSTPGSWWDIYTTTINPESGKVVSSPAEIPMPYQGYNRHPVWSPDGKYLAYVSVRRHLRKPNILCIFTKETGAIKKFANVKDVNRPIWFPDSQSVLLFGTDVLNITTGKIESVIPLQKDDELEKFALSISFDSKSIYYETRNKNWDKHAIIQKVLESSEEKELYTTSDDNLTMSLSPDNKQLAVLQRHNENTRILKILTIADSSEKVIHTFKQDSFGYIDLSWSPNGKYICFSKRTGTEKNKPCELWRISAQGGEAKSLGIAMNLFTSISFHPNGQLITFSSFVGKEKPGGVWIMENFLPKE